MCSDLWCIFPVIFPGFPIEFYDKLFVLEQTIVLLADTIAVFFSLQRLWQALVFWFASDLIEHVQGSGLAEGICLFLLEPSRIPLTSPSSQTLSVPLSSWS